MGSHHHVQDPRSKGSAILSLNPIERWADEDAPSRGYSQQMPKTLHESREGFFHSGTQLETASNNPPHTPLRIDFKGIKQGREGQ